jgi:hypothetical protein
LMRGHTKSCTVHLDDRITNKNRSLDLNGESANRLTTAGFMARRRRAANSFIYRQPALARHMSGPRQPGIPSTKTIGTIGFASSPC